MAKLCAEGVVICATFVFNAAQAVIAAKAGAAAVRVTLGDLEAYGQSGAQALAEIKNVLEAGGEECDVMAASIQSATQFAECATAGAGTVFIITPGVRSPGGFPLCVTSAVRCFS